MSEAKEAYNKKYSGGYEILNSDEPEPIYINELESKNEEMKKLLKTILDEEIIPGTIIEKMIKELLNEKRL